MQAFKAPRRAGRPKSATIPFPNHNHPPRPHEHVPRQRSTGELEQHSKSSSQPLTISKTTDIDQTIEKLPKLPPRRGLSVPKPRLSPRSRRPVRKESSSAMASPSAPLQKTFRTVRKDNDGCPSPVIPDRRPRSVHLPFFQESPGWRDAHTGRATDDFQVNSKAVEDPFAPTSGIVPPEPSPPQTTAAHIITIRPSRHSSIDNANSPNIWCVSRPSASPNISKAGEKLRHLLIPRKADAAPEADSKTSLIPAARLVLKKSSSKRLIGRIRGKPAMEDLRVQNQAPATPAAASVDNTIEDTILLPSAEDSLPTADKALGNQSKRDSQKIKSSSVSSFQIENSYLGQQIQDGQTHSTVTYSSARGVLVDAEKGCRPATPTRRINDSTTDKSLKEDSDSHQATTPPTGRARSAKPEKMIHTRPYQPGATTFNATPPLSPLQPQSSQTSSLPASPPLSGTRTWSKGLGRTADTIRHVDALPVQHEDVSTSPSQGRCLTQGRVDSKKEADEQGYQTQQPLRIQKSFDGLSIFSSAPTNSTSTLEGIESQVRYSTPLSSTSPLPPTVQASDVAHQSAQRSHNMGSPVAGSTKAPSDPPMLPLPQVPEYAERMDGQVEPASCHSSPSRPSSHNRLGQNMHQKNLPSTVSHASEASPTATVTARSQSHTYRQYQDSSSPSRNNGGRSTVSRRQLEAIDTTVDVNKYNLGLSRDLRSPASVHSQDSIISASGVKIVRYVGTSERTQKVEYLRHRDVASARQKKNRLRKVDELEAFRPDVIPEDFPPPPSHASTRPSSRQGSCRSSYETAAQPSSSSPLRRTTTTNDLPGQISRSDIVVLVDSNPHTDTLRASTVTPTPSVRGLQHRAASPVPLLPPSDATSIMARKIPRDKHSQRSVRSHLSHDSQYSAGHHPQAHTPPPSDESTHSSDEEGAVVALEAVRSTTAVIAALASSDSLIISRNSIMPVHVGQRFEKQLKEMQARLEWLEEENRELRNATDTVYRFLRYSRDHSKWLSAATSLSSSSSAGGKRREASPMELFIAHLNEPERDAQGKGAGAEGRTRGATS